MADKLSELNDRIILLKSQELTYQKALSDTHDGLMMAIGILEGYRLGFADGERHAKGITEVEKES